MLAVEPLPDGEPFEMVNSVKVWHPIWLDKIDSTVNAQFIQAVIERIWNNELV